MSRAGIIERRELERWTHPFVDEFEFSRVWAAAARLPERIAQSIDGPGMFILQLVRPDDTLTRERMNWPMSSDDARAFDELWDDLIGPVRTCLETLEVPPDLRSMTCPQRLLR